MTDMKEKNLFGGARRGWLGTLIAAAIVVGVAPSTASAADCGDAAGSGGARVACACGDTVVTSTYLRSSDPVVQNQCAGLGLAIGRSGITLDCRYNEMNGDGTDHGIYVFERERVAVKRCTVKGFLDGIRVGFGGSNSIYGNTVADNADDGIGVRDSDGNRIRYNKVSGNGESGIDLSTADGNSVYANKAYGNAATGVELGQNSNKNWVKKNYCKNNGKQGIQLSDDSGWNKVYLNWMSHNGSNGLLAKNSGHNSIMWNAAKDNGGDGLRLLEGSPSNYIKGFYAAGNGADGICVGSDSNKVMLSTAIDNGSDGVQNEATGEKNSYYANYSKENADYGYHDNSSGGGTAGTANRYSRNRCRNNGIDGSDPDGLCR